MTISQISSGGGVFALDAPASASNRTIVLPDASTTLVGTDATQTLTNKTLTNPTISGATITGGSIASLASALAIASGGTGVTALAQSIGTNGYQTLVGGLIIQWGYYAGGANNPTVNFPIAFPTACRGVWANISDGTAVTIYLPNTITTSSFRCDQRLYTGATRTDNFNWFAIGN